MVCLPPSQRCHCLSPHHTERQCFLPQPPPPTTAPASRPMNSSLPGRPVISLPPSSLTLAFK